MADCFSGNCAGFNGTFTLQKTGTCTWVVSAQGVTLTQISETQARLIFDNGNATAVYFSTNWSCNGGTFTIDNTNCVEYPTTITIGLCGSSSSPRSSSSSSSSSSGSASCGLSCSQITADSAAGGISTINTMSFTVEAGNLLIVKVSVTRSSIFNASNVNCTFAGSSMDGELFDIDTDGSTHLCGVLYYKKVTTDTTGIVTFSTTFGGGTGEIRLVVEKVSGLSQGGVLDQSSSNTGVSSANPSSGSIVTSASCTYCTALFSATPIGTDGMVLNGYDHLSDRGIEGSYLCSVGKTQVNSGSSEAAKSGTSTFDIWISILANFK